MSERGEWRLRCHCQFSFCICLLLVNSPRFIQLIYIYLPPPHGPRLSAGIEKKFQLGEERYDFLLSVPIICWFPSNYLTISVQVSHLAYERCRIFGRVIDSHNSLFFLIYGIYLCFSCSSLFQRSICNKKCRTHDKEISQLKRCHILLMSNCPKSQFHSGNQQMFRSSFFLVFFYKELFL